MKKLRIRIKNGIFDRRDSFGDFFKFKPKCFSQCIAGLPKVKFILISVVIGSDPNDMLQLIHVQFDNGKYFNGCNFLFLLILNYRLVHSSIGNYSNISCTFRWANIIQTSSLLMKQFDLMILIQPKSFKIQSVIPSRKYKNLTITLEGKIINLPSDVIEDLVAQSECIRNVYLVNFDRMNAILAISVLTNITKLTISNYRHEIDVLGIVDLPNLRHLELINSIPFAEDIDSHVLRILKVYGVYDTRNRSVDNYNDLSAGLNNFMMKCKHLKDLTLSNVQITNPILKSNLFEFNLVALTIENFNFDEENLIEFLVNQRKSLKKLAILNNSPKSIIPVIILSQLTLDELEIDSGIISSTFNPLIVNKTIKKLTIRSAIDQTYQNRQFYVFNHGGMDNQPQRSDPKITTEKIISACNAVEEFIILESSFDSLLQHLNWTNPHLKILKIQTLPRFISPTIEFDKLEIIEIDTIQNECDIENCQFLVIYSPNLQTLKINLMERELFTSKFFITIVSKSKNLKNIHIGTRCRFSLDMINTVRQIKGRGHPLQSISFVCCIMDDKNGYNINDIFMDGLKLNFHQNSNNFFSLIVNETRLGRMKRELDDKHKDLEQQRRLSIFREHQIKKYEREY